MKVKLLAVYAFALAGMAYGSHEFVLVIEKMQAQVMADKYCSGIHLNEQLCQRSRLIAQQN